MAVVSFVDDNFQLADAFLKRDYTELSSKIQENSRELTVCQQYDDVILGAKITKNNPLSEQFQDEFFVVRFQFSNIDTLHNEKQYENMLKMFGKLKEKMDGCHGYYNMRIPSHIVDAVKAYNQVFHEGIFCGGTVEEVIAKKQVEITPKEGLQVFFADSAYVNRHKESLMNMTFKSFETYQGQYHISPVTENGAGQIYENWIKESLDHCDKNIVVAEYHGEPVGFVTIAERENGVEGVLSAVEGRFRKLGAYRTMISYIVNYAENHHKCFITSTQFDNFIVQGVWNSIGLKPFYSIYNFHIDKREK